MPIARLQRTREAYMVEPSLSVPIVTSPPIFVDDTWERYRVGDTIIVSLPAPRLGVLVGATL